MRPFQLDLPVALHEQLKAASLKSGAPMAEIIRRAITEYLKEAHQ